MISAAVRLADRIITDSKFSRDDIVRYLGVDPDKIEVVYPGISSEFRPVNDSSDLENVRRKYGIKSDFIVYTGIYINRAKTMQHSCALFRSSLAVRSTPPWSWWVRLARENQSWGGWRTNLEFATR